MRRMNPKSGAVAAFVLWGILAIVILLIVAMKAIPRAPEAGEVVPEAAVPVEVVTIEPVAHENVVALTGRLIPDVHARLAALKPGRVRELPVRKGDVVKEGDLLLRLEDRLARAALRQTVIREDEARRDFERWETLRETGAVSASEFEQIQMALDTATIAREAAEVNVEFCEVRSPCDGVVDERLVELGEYAHEGGHVLTVVRTDPLKLSFSVPERDIFAAVVGAPAVFAVSAYPGRAFTGKVSFVAAAAEAVTSAFRVEAVVANPAGELKPGMIASVQFKRGARDGAIVIPLAAVVPARGEHVVFVAKDDRAERRVVRIAAIAGQSAVIESGVDAGDEVIIRGHRALIDGALIQRDSPGTDAS